LRWVSFKDIPGSSFCISVFNVSKWDIRRKEKKKSTLILGVMNRKTKSCRRFHKRLW